MLAENSALKTTVQQAVQRSSEKQLDMVLPGGRWSHGKCLLGIIVPIEGNFTKIRIEPDTDEACSLSFSKVIFTGTVDEDGVIQNIGKEVICSQSSFYRHKVNARSGIDSPVYEMGTHTNKEDLPWWQAEFPKKVALKQMFLYLRSDSHAYQNKYLRIFGVDAAGRERLIYRTGKGDFYKQTTSDYLVKGIDAVANLRRDVAEVDLEAYETKSRAAFAALSSALTAAADGKADMPTQVRENIAQQLLDVAELAVGGTKDYGLTEEDGYVARFAPTNARYVRLRAYGAHLTSFGGVQILSEKQPDTVLAEYKGKQTQLQFHRTAAIRPEYFALGLHGNCHSRIMDMGESYSFDAIRLWNINKQQTANSLIVEMCVSDDRINWRTVYDKGIGFQYISELLALVDLLLPTTWLPDYARLRGKLYTQYRRPVMVDPMARFTRKKDDLLKAVFAGSEEIFLQKQHAAPLRMGKHGLRVPLAFRDEKITMGHLVKVRDEIRALGHKPLFMYGTLLGAIREKDFIPHDDDIDLAIIIEDLHPDNLIEESVKMLATLNEAGIKTTRGSVGAPLLHCQRPPLTIDIFVFAHYEDKIYWLHKGLATVPERDDIFLPIKTIEFKGEIFDAPNDPEAVSEARYGADWRIPNAAFEW